MNRANNTEGWTRYNSSTQIRILADEPWYAEFSNGSNHWLSPVTLLFLYLKFHCDEYGIESNPDGYYWKASSIMTRDNFSSTPKLCNWRNGDWITNEVSNRAGSYCMFVTKYEDVTISNSNGGSDHFDDFFLLTFWSHCNDSFVGGWRQQIPFSHYNHHYLHSHLNNYSYRDGMSVGSFCTGVSSTAINRTLRHLRNFLSSRNNLIDLSKPLLTGEIPSNFESLFNQFEAKALAFKAAWLPLISHESLEGGPYKYLKNNVDRLAEAPCQEKDLDAFAKLISESADDERLKFNIRSNSIQVLDSPGLVEFAKEHGYYEKCFGLRIGASRNYIFDVNQTVSGMTTEQFLKTSKKTMFCRSPFKWNGERLSIILSPTSKVNQNGKTARINTKKRTYFDTRVTHYFNKGLLLRVL